MHSIHVVPEGNLVISERLSRIEREDELSSGVTLLLGIHIIPIRAAKRVVDTRPTFRCRGLS